MSKVECKIDLSGLEDILNSESAIRVGVIEDATCSKHYPSEVWQYAWDNEFGVPDDHIPQRSFIRHPVEYYTFEYFLNYGNDFLTKLFSDGINSALGDMGEYIVWGVSDNIRSEGVDAEDAWQRNTESTIENKGFDMPMTHTGTLARSIGYEILSGENGFWYGETFINSDYTDSFGFL